jgi:hypothetical protein
MKDGSPDAKKYALLNYVFFAVLFFVLFFQPQDNRVSSFMKSHPLENWPQSILYPIDDCFNLLVVTTHNAGLGHRLIALAIAISFIIRSNSSATLVLDKQYFSHYRDGVSYDLSFVNKFQGIKSILTTESVAIEFADGSNIADISSFTAPFFETAWGLVFPKAFGSVEATIIGTATSNACGIVALLPCGHPKCTHDDGTLSWCFSSEHVDIGTARPLITHLFVNDYFSTNLMGIFPNRYLHSSTLNVAWHIRNDDILLTNGGPDFLNKLISVIMDVLAFTKIVGKHWIIAQNPILESDPNFGTLYSHSGFNATFLTSLQTLDAFQHLVFADILVHTGSTFALSAALVAHESQVFLYGLPKESNNYGDHAWRAQFIPGCVPILPGGAISPEDKTLLVQKLLARISYLRNIQHPNSVN